MPRNMSFALTTEEFKNKTKTVTRRFGWWFLRPGDQVWGVEKAMGLPKGQKIKRLGLIQIVSSWPEPLNAITPGDCIKEGFPHLTPEHFVKMLCELYQCPPDKKINRIEFKYL
jgi:hypothetical protein